jgi:hypothetical protein
MAQNAPVGGVGATKSVSDDKSIPGDPGALEGFSDGSWRFTGDGQTNLSQVAGRMIQIDQSKGEFSGLNSTATNNLNDPNAARAGAKLIIAQNGGLNGMTPETPVPNGQPVDIEWQTIRGQLKTLANNLDTLKAFVANGGEIAGMDSKTASVIGKGRGPGGRGLPID